MLVNDEGVPLIQGFPDLCEVTEDPTEMPKTKSLTKGLIQRKDCTGGMSVQEAVKSFALK